MRNHHTMNLLTALALVSIACGSGSNTSNGGQAITFRPPNRSYADSLGIALGPVTADQAEQIAAAAAGGVATAVEQEDEDGTMVFGVHVQAPAGLKDVKVRISDGAVTKIEDDGPETGGEGGGED
ncbi:MAG TPA: hypothetical protein VLK88_14470 [Gemmatimonadales bacterium]|nr:hypothetical protein [Gemmatimonadales bacterium]